MTVQSQKAQNTTSDHISGGGCNMRRSALVVLSIVTLASLASDLAASGITFHTFAPDDGKVFSYTGMSHDGSWVVGRVSEGFNTPSQPAVWNVNRGLELIDAQSSLVGASNSGEVLGDFPAPGIWRTNEDEENLELSTVLNGTNFATGWISGNGTTVLGVTQWNDVGVALPAVWKAPDFVVDELPLPVGFVNGFPKGVSADGSLAIGWVSNASHDEYRAVEWDISANTVSFITDDNGNFFDIAIAISPDKSAVIVENFATSSPFLLVDGERYTLPLGSQSVSNGGHRVVGTGGGLFVWDLENGKRPILSILEQSGVPIGDWAFGQRWPPYESLVFPDLIDISGDGEVISGIGWPDGQGSGWVLRLPVPEPASVALAIFGSCFFMRARQLSHF